MKRNSKPFSVEIRKSRGHSPSNHVPPRRLFATVSAEDVTNVQVKEPPAAAEQAVPRRVLPSLVEPAWSFAEPLAPAPRKRLTRSKASQEQIELDLDVSASKAVPAEPAPVLEPVPQADVAPSHQEGSGRVQTVRSQKAEKAKPRKRRRQGAEIVEPAAIELISEPGQVSRTAVTALAPAGPVQAKGHQRQARRQAAADQLPRHERWKRRLHPATW